MCTVRTPRPQPQSAPTQKPVVYLRNPFLDSGAGRAGYGRNALRIDINGAPAAPATPPPPGPGAPGGPPAGGSGGGGGSSGGWGGGGGRGGDARYYNLAIV